MKLWAGRFQKELDSQADSFNSSISFDQKLVFQDIKGSKAHAEMLCNNAIISPEDYKAILGGLEEIEKDISAGTLKIDQTAEDVHMFVEAELTQRIGEPGKRLHTARSRNDQVATDVKLYILDKCAEIKFALCELIKTLCNLSQTYSDVIMPGYTHLQRAQPVTFGHHLMAYAQMFLRDVKNINHCLSVTAEQCPLGSGALAGTTYPINRFQTAEALGFSAPSVNSMDGVSDRDSCILLASFNSLVMVHLSRFAEEVILWSSWEYKFITLDDSFSTGSSIMPQKKNPDMAELVRGKSGRAFGSLITLLTLMKGLPLAYNKDMQEDKEALFDSVETVLSCLEVFTPMLGSITVHQENMLGAAQKGFLNATDVADYLVKKGLAFRSAYKITGELVAYCIEKGAVLTDLSLDEYLKFSPLFADDLYGAISLESCVAGRTSFGGPATVKEQINLTLSGLEECF